MSRGNRESRHLSAVAPHLSYPPSGGGGLLVTQVDVSVLKCPKCNRLFEKPKRLPCGHTLCYNCIEFLKRKTGSYFHCPVQNCGTLIATSADMLRTNVELERAVQQWQQNQRRVCQMEGCVSTDIAWDRCPHCDMRVCREHVPEHCDQFAKECEEQLTRMKSYIWDIQTSIEQCQLRRRGIEHLIQESERHEQHLRDVIEQQFMTIRENLLKYVDKFDIIEACLTEALDKSLEIKQSISDALAIPEENELQSVLRNQSLIASAQRMLKSFQRPRLPEDVRLYAHSCDLESVVANIKTLTVVESELQLQQLKHPNQVCIHDVRCRPNHAAIWCNTGKYTVTNQEIKRRTTDQQEKLPDEVMLWLLENETNLFASTLNGDNLGRLVVYNNTRFRVNSFSVSPDGETLAILSKVENKVLICDMDGTVRVTVGREALPRLTSLHSMCLSDQLLMIVDSGRDRNAGAVWVLEGREFDPRKIKRIPLEGVKRNMFPVAASCMRGGYFVLGMKGSTASGQNELLLYNRECQFVADISQDITSAEQMCSDASGRIFISVNRRHDAHILVLNPQGRCIGTLRDRRMNSCQGISHSGQYNRSNRLVVCDPERQQVFIYHLAP